MKPIRTFDLLDRYIGLFPEQDALAAKKDGKWVIWSARQYYENAHHFGCGLLELGFMKGDKIVTITNNRPEWNFVDMGMAMAGVVHVPVYTSMTCEEYRYIIEHSDARMVIISERKLYETIKPVCDQVKNVEHIFSFDIIEGAASWTEVLEKGKRCRPEPLKSLKR